MDIMQMLMQSVGGNVVREAAEKFGIDPNMAQSVVNMATPAIMNQFGKQASTEQGANNISNAMDSGDFGNLLGMVMGNKQNAVQNHIAQQTGADSGMVGNIMQMLGPMLMGGLNQQRQDNGFDVMGLASQLMSNKQAMDGVLGALSPFLDSDKDGDVDLNDLMKLGGGLFGGQR